MIRLTESQIVYQFDGVETNSIAKVEAARVGLNKTQNEFEERSGKVSVWVASKNKVDKCFAHNFDAKETHQATAQPSELWRSRRRSLQERVGVSSKIIAENSPKSPWPRFEEDVGDDDDDDQRRQGRISEESNRRVCQAGSELDIYFIGCQLSDTALDVHLRAQTLVDRLRSHSEQTRARALGDMLPSPRVTAQHALLAAIYPEKSAEYRRDWLHRFWRQDDNSTYSSLSILAERLGKHCIGRVPPSTSFSRAIAISPPKSGIT